MRNFIWLFSLLIVAISLPGFSTTTDLTEDSSIAFVDVDVGIDASVDLITINEISNSSTFTRTAYLAQKSQYDTPAEQILFRANEKELTVILDIYHPPAKLAIKHNRARESI